jgi:hypothetical protein
MVRPLVVSALVGALVLGIAPRQALAADDWFGSGDHYRCMWHCEERAGQFRATAVSPPGSTPAATPSTSPSAGTGAGTGTGFGLLSWLATIFDSLSAGWHSPSPPSGASSSGTSLSTAAPSYGGWTGGSSWTGYGADPWYRDDGWYRSEPWYGSDGWYQHDRWYDDRDDGWYRPRRDRDRWWNLWGAGYRFHRHHPRDGY